MTAKMILNQLGIKVFHCPVLDPQPRMTLSEKVMVTPEFRDEMNRWMREFFGMTEPTGSVLFRNPVTGQELLYADTATYNAISEEVLK